MKSVGNILNLLIGLAILFLVSACSTPASTALSDAAVLSTAQAANPLPTQLSGQGLRVVSNQACVVKEYVTIHVQDAQGDLIAWSPLHDELALVEPTNLKWGWFVGDLVVYDLALDKEVFVSQDQQVSGDLTWSPDASYLAYVVLDPKAKIYTVDLIGMTNYLSTEVFGGTNSARTDEWSSTKGISEWSSPRNLIVTSSCGLDCSRTYNFNTDTLRMTVQGETRKSEDTSLTLTNQDTSPDGKWQITTDNKDNVWLSSTKNSQASLLLANTVISEIKWSASSNYFALRTVDHVLIYEPLCSKK